MMVIPHDRDIKLQLVKYLASRPDRRAHAQSCYAALEPLFPQLTNEEVTLRYQTSVSKWANAVQFARLHLVNEGLIYRAGEGPNPSKGVWILTPEGVRAAERGLPIRGRSRPSGRALNAKHSVAFRSVAQGGDGIILGWNRDLWDEWPDTYEGTVNRLIAGDRYETRWSVGKRVDVPPGTEAWLLRQGRPFGVIGHGTVTSNTFIDAHFANAGETSRYVNVEFDVLLLEEDLLPREQLELLVPEVKWRHQFTSGNRVPATANARLKQLWTEHIS